MSQDMIEGKVQRGSDIVSITIQINDRDPVSIKLTNAKVDFGCEMLRHDPTPEEKSFPWITREATKGRKLLVSGDVV